MRRVARFLVRVPKCVSRKQITCPIRLLLARAHTVRLLGAPHRQALKLSGHFIRSLPKSREHLGPYEAASSTILVSSPYPSRCSDDISRDLPGARIFPPPAWHAAHLESNSAAPASDATAGRVQCAETARSAATHARATDAAGKGTWGGNMLRLQPFGQQGRRAAGASQYGLCAAVGWGCLGRAVPYSTRSIAIDGAEREAPSPSSWLHIIYVAVIL
eukprot:1098722-Pleurochrysis_carterae.AAC.1